jgi:biopolymer transport protein ExbD
MAEVNTDGGGGGKHGKKGRKKGGGNPRVDMTPMVDLAFLLLTFFVLTSNLNKAKTMEMAVPKDRTDTSIHNFINYKYARTILLDGNKEGKIYLYEGKLDGDVTPALLDFTLDAKKGLRQYLLEQNEKIHGEMKFLRTVYKSGKFQNDSYGKLKQILAEKARPAEGDPDTTAAKRKREDYSAAIARLDRDLAKGEMSDTTFKLVSSNIKNDDNSPFFIVKWGADAKYADVINVIDELKIGDVSKYALTRISPAELQSLSAKTGRRYKELENAPAAAAPAQ